MRKFIFGLLMCISMVSCFVESEKTDYNLSNDYDVNIERVYNSPYYRIEKVTINDSLASFVMISAKGIVKIE